MATFSHSFRPKWSRDYAGHLIKLLPMSTSMKCYLPVFLLVVLYPLSLNAQDLHQVKYDNIGLESTTTSWNESIAFQAFRFAMISYCPSSCVTNWNCSWCSDVSDTFKTYDVSYDANSDTSVYIGHDPSSSQIVVSFRGTKEDSIMNWIYDLSMAKVKMHIAGHPDDVNVHEGFYDAWNIHKDAVLSAVGTLQKKYPSYSILVTGHSLGASMATLCVVDLRFNYGFRISSLINFGSPRTGDKKFADIVRSSFDVWRVTHNADIVSSFPSRGFWVSSHCD